MTISLLKKTKLEFSRKGVAVNNGDGTSTLAVDRVIGARGSLQPYRVKGSTEAKLPSGIGSGDALTFFTETELRTANGLTKTTADTTVIDGYPYEVFAVENWSRFGLSADNYQCTLIRKEQQS